MTLTIEPQTTSMTEVSFPSTRFVAHGLVHFITRSNDFDVDQCEQHVVETRDRTTGEQNTLLRAWSPTAWVNLSLLPIGWGVPA
jgi:hypothetical protein